MSNLAEVTQEKMQPELLLDETQLVRANSYALLAGLLARPPEAEFLQQLAEMQVDTREQKGIVHAWSSLKLAAQTARQAGVEDEFFALFIGIGRGEMVPFASWYLTGFLMEKPLAQLRYTLDQLGFERQAEVKEPEDHVAALFEVMACLVRDLDVDFATQQQFFSEHIQPWIKRFFHELQQAQNARFYRAVAQLGEEFMAIEERYFSMLV